MRNTPGALADSSSLDCCRRCRARFAGGAEQDQRNGCFAHGELKTPQHGAVDAVEPADDDRAGGGAQRLSQGPGALAGRTGLYHQQAGGVQSGGSQRRQAGCIGWCDPRQPAVPAFSFRCVCRVCSIDHQGHQKGQFAVAAAIRQQLSHFPCRPASARQGSIEYGVPGRNAGVGSRQFIAGAPHRRMPELRRYGKCRHGFTPVCRCGSDRPPRLR
jgi:hypothetical protein